MECRPKIAVQFFWKGPRIWTSRTKPVEVKVLNQQIQQEWGPGGAWIFSTSVDVSHSQYMSFTVVLSSGIVISDRVIELAKSPKVETGHIFGLVWFGHIVV